MSGQTEMDSIKNKYFKVSSDGIIMPYAVSKENKYDTDSKEKEFEAQLDAISKYKQPNASIIYDENCKWHEICHGCHIEMFNVAISNPNINTLHIKHPYSLSEYRHVYETLRDRRKVKETVPLHDIAPNDDGILDVSLSIIDGDKPLLLHVKIDLNK